MSEQANSSITGATETPTLSGAAGRYAEALFDLAKDAGAIDGVEDDMRSLSAAITGSNDFRDFLRSPVYGREEKENAIVAVVDKAGLSGLSKNFIGLVAKKGRLFALEEMIDGFGKLAAHHRGEVRAEAVSAAPLNDEQLRRLRGEIEGIVGKAVNLNTSVDPDLLGGLIVKVGSTMIDSSLRTKLNKLKSAMKEA